MRVYSCAEILRVYSCAELLSCYSYLGESYPGCMLAIVKAVGRLPDSSFWPKGNTADSSAVSSLVLKLNFL